jgi:hypothetical protein
LPPLRARQHLGTGYRRRQVFDDIDVDLSGEGGSASDDYRAALLLVDVQEPGVFRGGPSIGGLRLLLGLCSKRSACQSDQNQNLERSNPHANPFSG